MTRLEIQRLLLGLGSLCAVACASTREAEPGLEQPRGQEQHAPDAALPLEETSGDARAPDASMPVVQRDASGPEKPPVVDNDAATAGLDAGRGEPAIDAGTLSLTPCPEEDAAVCPASDPLCFWESGPGGGGGGGPEGYYSFFTGWSMCTRFCESDADCPSDIGAARCLPSVPGGDRICLFECTFGRSCPGELSCSNGDRCGHHFCECTGAGCEQPLCTLE